jgi:CTP:molybdopterin cytidylyltransferase MocA
MGASRSEVPGLAGVLLAAGRGARFGGPKALARTADGEPWVALAARRLVEAGCGRVLVVLGADARRAAPLVPREAEVVVAEGWAEGLSASLTAGLGALGGETAALITLVDLPGLPASVHRRILVAGATPSSLRRATYDGRPGHPVLAGREHWAGMAAAATGDHGARDHLAAAGVELVECGDLFSGADVDRRA